MTTPTADRIRLGHILADDLQPRIDWAYTLEQEIAVLSGGGLTSWGLASQATYVHAGDPNGVVTAAGLGDFLIDTSTPALWIAVGAGTVWTQATGGGGGGGVTSVDGMTGVVSLASTYQPLDSDLTAIAALSTTSYGRSVLTQANAAALRTLAGLGTAATSNTGDFDAAGAAAAAQDASQPLDSDLTAIAALATTSFGRAFLALADAAATLTALGLDTDLATFALPASTTISTFGASLIDDAAASNARTTLGLGTAAVAASTDFDAAGAAAAAQAASQPLDTDLTAIAALTTTSYGRGVLALADAAALRTYAGLGTIATQNANNVTISGGSVTGITDLLVADGGTGLSTLTAHAVQVGAGTSSPAQVGPDAATTKPLFSAGSSADPAFRAIVVGDLPTGTGSSNVPVGGVITGAGPTGDASHTLTLTYNAAGQLTAVTNNAIAIAESQVTNLVSDLALKAPLASPTLTGTPAAPTAAANNNSTQLATTAYADTADALKLSILTPQTSKTANYTLTTTDTEVLADSSGGAFTLTLPTPVGVRGKRYTIKRVDNTSTSGLYPVTVATVAGTIDGASTDIIGSPLEAVTYVSDNANWKKDSGWQPPLPHSSRVIIWSTSHDAAAQNPYSATSIAWPEAGVNIKPWDGNQWGGALKDAFGTGQYADNTKAYAVPAVAAATTTTTFLDFMPADGTIEAVWWVPATPGITGANTNTRSIQLQVDTASGTNANIGFWQFNSGFNATTSVPISLFNVASGGGITQASVFIPTKTTPYFPALRGTNSSTTMSPQGIFFKSAAVGTGLADPGGVLIVRFGTRTRNYSVSGSQLMAMSGPPVMNWTTVFSWGPNSRPNAPEVNVTATAASSATSITCSALQFPLLNGSVVRFSSGHTATLTSGANYAATSIAVSALANSILIGEQGHVAFVNGTSGAGSYESLSPTGLNIFFTGVNDTAQTIDRPAWIETCRSVMARVCCSAFDTINQGNFQYTNGGGTWAALTASTGVSAAGSLPYIFDATGTLAEMKVWTGTVSGTPKVDMTVGPAFEGGIIDLFFLVPAGANRGVTASVTVDGGTPPQGAVTINTESVSTSGLLSRTITGTYATATSTTLTLSSAGSITVADLGKIITGTDIPAGTTITTITDTTHVVISQAATSTHSGLTGIVGGWTPMVKRLTGLAAGAHTITVTITASNTVATSALVLAGYGIETANPPTPVAWLNILTSVGQSTTNATNYNTDTLAVINGTAAAISGNSTEPAFGTNVQYIDIATLFNQNPAFFLSDGLHLNSAGHRLIDRTIWKTLHDFYTPDQLIAR